MNKIKTFEFKDFKISINIIKVFISLSFSLLSFILISIFQSSLYINQGNTLFILTAITLFLISVIFSINISLNNVSDLSIKVIYGIKYFLAAILTYLSSETLNFLFLSKPFALNIYILNILCIFLLSFILYGVCGNYKVSFYISISFTFLISLINYFVYSFRGTPFLPMDIFGIQTAIKVVNNYRFFIDGYLIFSILLFVLAFIITLKIKTISLKGYKNKCMLRVISITLAGIIFSCYYFTPVLEKFNITPNYWNASYSTKDRGITYNFLLNIKNLIKEKPDGYNKSRCENILSKYKTDDNLNNKPNIICIMNESFSDLHVLGDFETNEEYMPFITKLSKNTIKGNLFVSALGGNTSNSEFEFLTGISMANLPSGTNAYSSNTIKNNTPSLVSHLNSLGYQTIAFHPFVKTGWNRNNIYKQLGFKDFISIDNLFPTSIANDYAAGIFNKEYFNKNNVLLRDYVSDEYDYKEIIKLFESKKDNKPLFLFNVTMQNHGGYKNKSDSFKETIHLIDNPYTDINEFKNYPETNQYLSLIKESDAAFKNLVKYFSKIKEPTIICMFGDHQPALTDGFIESLTLNTDKSLLEIEQAKRTVPYIIWANFDIEEKDNHNMSLNYLSSYLLKYANVKNTVFNEYLLDLHNQLPIINSVGYYDSQNNIYSEKDNSNHKEILNEYKCISYYLLNDCEK